MKAILCKKFTSSGYVGVTTFRRRRQVGAVFRFCKRRKPVQYDIALSEVSARRTMESDAGQLMRHTDTANH